MREVRTIRRGTYTTPVRGAKRFTRAAAIAMFCASVCSIGLALDARSTQDTSAISFGLQLHPSEYKYEDRVREAALESLTQYSDWLGAPPPAPVMLVSRAVPAVAAPEDLIVIDLPWRSADSTMEIEAAVASAIAMRYWPHDAAHAAFARGLSWYLQSRVVERLFNVRFARPGHSADGVRLFGGFVPIGFSTLVVSRWTDHLSRERGAVAFAALERYLGWPTLQGALAALAASMHDARLTPQHANAVISRAAGQDLTWFFATAFDSNAAVDYALGVLSSTSCPAQSCYRTSVTIVRRGAAFTGSSPPRVGPYESGTGVGVEVRFEDGQTAVARWDGLDPQRTFEFESPSVPVSARLDPEGALLLDATPLDHTWSRDRRSNVPIMKWTVRWMVWLQDALLAYAALV